jgi:type I restriction enzyme S subunit
MIQELDIVIPVKDFPAQGLVKGDVGAVIMVHRGLGMVREWREAKVEEVCSLIVDCVNKTAPVVEGPTPYKMVRTTNIRNGRVDLSDCKYVEKETFEKWTRRAAVLDSDVLLTREAPIGEVGYVQGAETIFLGQRIMQYRANPGVLHSRFLLYAFLSPKLRQQFGAHEGSGSVISHIRVGDCFKFQIPLPDLDEQRRIAHVLGTLDDKIENNRKTAKTLEAMAQAIFQSWFVDFDPVRAKMAGESKESICKRLKLTPEILDLFPDRLVDSELGEIPEGWEIGTLESLAALVTDSVSPGRSPNTVFEHYSIPAFDVGRMPAMELGESIKSNKYLVKQNAVLVSKLNPHTPRIWLPSIGKIPAICSTEFMQFVPPTLGDRSYLYCLMNSQSMQEEVLKHVTGSTGSRQRAQPSQISKVKILFTQSYIQKVFTHKASLLLNAAAINLMESITLASLRDTILPKLISGEIRVPEAEDLVQEATI